MKHQERSLAENRHYKPMETLFGPLAPGLENTTPTGEDKRMELINDKYSFRYIAIVTIIVTFLRKQYHVVFALIFTTSLFY